VTDKVGVKLASALLLYYGEISKEDIRAIPFFANPGESEAAIKCLLGTFDVEVYQRKIASYPVPQWEEVIKVRDSMQYQRRRTASTDE
jgi:hypothetical protein